MPQSRREHVVLGVHQHVDGMRGHDPVNKHTAEDNKVLYRMHGNSGPGPNIDVFVMEVMHPLKERRPVQETMDPIKVKYTNNWHEDEQQDEIDRMFLRIDVWQHLVGIGPHHQHFIRCPDRDSTATTPEDVVKELVSPVTLIYMTFKLDIRGGGKYIYFPVSGIQNQPDQFLVRFSFRECVLAF